MVANARPQAVRALKEAVQTSSAIMPFALVEAKAGAKKRSVSGFWVAICAVEAGGV